MIYYESEIVELKESVNETLAKEMVAFLNSFGGTIYIGVTDKGIVKVLTMWINHSGRFLT